MQKFPMLNALMLQLNSFGQSEKSGVIKLDTKSKKARMTKILLFLLLYN